MAQRCSCWVYTSRIMLSFLIFTSYNSISHRNTGIREWNRLQGWLVCTGELLNARHTDFTDFPNVPHTACRLYHHLSSLANPVYYLTLCSSYTKNERHSEFADFPITFLPCPMYLIFHLTLGSFCTKNGRPSHLLPTFLSQPVIPMLCILSIIYSPLLALTTTAKSIPLFHFFVRESVPSNIYAKPKLVYFVSVIPNTYSVAMYALHV